ncbi:MAG: recombinase family protein [Steroidobacteraceae bacterium]
MLTKSRAYSYVRFSTPEQLKGDSLRRQTALATDYALKHGLILDTELRLRDLGVSAFRSRNVATGALGVFLKAVDDGIVEPGSFLLVEALDRLSRENAYDAMLTLQNIINRDVTVVTLMGAPQIYSRFVLQTEPYKIFTVIGEFIRGNSESQMKSDRLKAAWSNKRKHAAEVALSAIVPGWIRLNEKRKPVLIRERAAIVKRIVRDYMRGNGKLLIAQKLNTAKVPPFGRAKMWRKSYIFKLLLSPALIGTFIPCIQEYRDGRKRRVPQSPVLNYYPPVISVDTYTRLQVLCKKTPARGVRLKRKMMNIFSALARCPECNSIATRTTKGSRKKAGKPFLVCTKAKAAAGCVYHMVPYAPLESALLENLDRILDEMPAPDVSLEANYRNTSVAADVMADKVAELLEQLERSPSDALAGRLAELEAAAKVANAARDAAAANIANAESKVLKLKTVALSEAIHTKPLDRARVNAALRELLERVVIDYRSGHLEFHWRAGGTSSIMYGWPTAHRKRRKRQSSAPASA